MQIRTILASLVGVSVLFSITGCATVDKNDNVISLKQNYETINAPQWDASSVEIFDTSEWTVNNYQKEALAGGDFLPSTFGIESKDGSCTVSYTVRYEPLKNSAAGEDYLSRTFVKNQIISGQEINPETANISILENNSKLQMLETKTTTDNFEVQVNTEPIAPPVVPDKTPAKVKGKRTTVQLTRVFAKEYTNPYDKYSTYSYSETMPSDYTPPDRSKGNPIIILSYSCANKELNMNLWKDIISNAQINSNPLPISTPNK